MSPLLFAALIGAGLGPRDWNVPGELRLQQALEVPMYGQIAFTHKKYPWISLYGETSLYLKGNNNPPLGAFPHAPNTATWGFGLRIERDWYYFDAHHESFHVVPAPNLFATRQFSGFLAGFRFGDYKLTAPHLPPGL